MTMVSQPIIEIVIPIVEKLNIWEVSVDQQIVQTKAEKAQKKRKKKNARDAQKARRSRSQDGQDQEMTRGSSGLRDPSTNVDRFDDMTLSIFHLVPVGTVANESGTRSKVPHTDINAPMP